MKTNRMSLLFIGGILVIAVSQIVAHYAKLTDLKLGAVTGVGFGLLVLSFLKPKKHRSVK